MTLIRRPQRFSELMSLPTVVDRMFEDLMARPWSWLSSEFTPSLPLLDVRVTGDTCYVEAAVPGIRPEDVDITIEGDMLTIKGEFKKEEKREEEGYLLREMQRGAFSRTITLPSGLKADAAKATFKDGVLTLEIPKEETSKARHVKVQVAR
jgi:HSP20 family protein